MIRGLFSFVTILAASLLVADVLKGQATSMQSFTIAAGSFYSNQIDALQIEWRLDLGLTALEMNNAPNYLFTPGFIQPIINRFTNKIEKDKYDPKIQLRYNHSGHKAFLFSNETDLMIYGFQIVDLHGRIIFKDQSMFASSYFNKPLELSNLSTGTYFVFVFYLPESISPIQNNYWMKSLKLLKQ